MAEFTLKDSKLRYEQSAAKTLIYQADPTTNPNLKDKKKTGRRGLAAPGSNPVDVGASPYAVQEIPQGDKYEGHQNFQRRKVNRNVMDKVGGSKRGGDGFDPALYSAQLAELQRSKVESNYKNYRGCGNIIAHASNSRPGSRQPPHVVPGNPEDDEHDELGPDGQPLPPPKPLPQIPRPAQAPPSSVPWAIDD